MRIIWAVTAGAIRRTALLTLLAVAIASCTAVPAQVDSAGASSAPSLGLDGRYGWLVATRPGPGSSVILVDETGQTLSDPIDGVSAAVSSPNSRVVALWVTSPQGVSELRFLDTVLRPVVVGAPVFTTTDRLVERGMVWANDSSAVAIATTSLARTGESGSVRITIRTIDRRTASANVVISTNLALALLGWNRERHTIALTVQRPDSLRPVGPAQYATLDELGRGDLNVMSTSDTPVTADWSGRYVASVGPCTSGPGCRAVIVHDLMSYQPLSESALPQRGGWGVTFRPRSSDLLIQLERASDMNGITFALELWPDLGHGQKRELAAVTVQWSGGSIADPGMLLRADGSAASLLRRASDGTWSGDLVQIATLGHAPISIRQPLAAVVVDGKLEGAPPVHTPQPTPLRYPVRTAEEVLRGMPNDLFVTGTPPGTPSTFDPATLGVPLFVHALRQRDRDVWLVPVLSGLGGSKPYNAAVIVVSVDADGLGAAGIRVGGDSGPPGIDVPPISEVRARSIASVAITDVTAADLVWMLVPPIAGFLCEEFYPMWRLNSGDGTVVYVTGDGQLKTAAEIDQLR